MSAPYTAEAPWNRSPTGLQPDGMQRLAHSVVVQVEGMDVAGCYMHYIALNGPNARCDACENEGVPRRPCSECGRYEYADEPHDHSTEA